MCYIHTYIIMKFIVIILHIIFPDPGISTNIMFIIVTVILGVVLLGSIGLMVYVCYQKISIVSGENTAF